MQLCPGAEEGRGGSGPVETPVNTALSIPFARFTAKKSGKRHFKGPLEREKSLRKNSPRVGSLGCGLEKDVPLIDLGRRVWMEQAESETVAPGQGWQEERFHCNFGWMHMPKASLWLPGLLLL